MFFHFPKANTCEQNEKSTDYTNDDDETQYIYTNALHFLHPTLSRSLSLYMNHVTKTLIKFCENVSDEVNREQQYLQVTNENDIFTICTKLTAV